MDSKNDGNVFGARGGATVAGSGGSVTEFIATGVILFEAAEAELLPFALVATTVHTTATPFVRPITVSGEVPPALVRAPQVAT